jgi:hypothetical protein
MVELVIIHPSFPFKCECGILAAEMQDSATAVVRCFFSAKVK